MQVEKELCAKLEMTQPTIDMEALEEWIQDLGTNRACMALYE